MATSYLASGAEQPRTVPSTEAAKMKARVLLVILVLALVSACSTSAPITAAENPRLDGGGMMGSGHRGDSISDEPETYSSPVIGSGH